MSRLLPVVDNALPFLPIEIWIIILRLLDPKSLLAGIRANSLWMTISQGDPVLRKTLRRVVKEDEMMVRNFILDPKMSRRVSRTPSNIFATNVRKTVVAVTRPTIGVLPNLASHVKVKQKDVGKSSKRHGNNRFCNPIVCKYKIM